MTRQILFFLPMLPTLLLGQETIEISSNNREVYNVLESNIKIKQGSYKRLDDLNDFVRVEGYYNNNTKDSIWTIYNDNGELEQQFDFTHNRLLYYKIDKSLLEQKYKVISDNSSFDTMLERPPLYIGGDLLFFDNILENLKYPDSASIKGISGDVFISFIVDKNGKTRSHMIKKGIGYGCNEEALRVVRNIPETWLAGILNGQAVDVEVTLAINFNVQFIPLSGH